MIDISKCTNKELEQMFSGDISKYTNEELAQVFIQQQKISRALPFATSGRRGKIANKKRARLHIDFKSVLNDNINLYKYVKKGIVSQIIIVYQIFNLQEDEKYNFHRKEKAVYNEDGVNDLSTYPLMTKEEYKQFVHGTEKEALKVLCKKTIDGITALKKYEKKLNFDWQGLNAELSELFKKEMNYLA